MKLGDFLIAYGRDHDVSRSYLYQLQYAVDRFAAWLGRPPIVEDLTRDSINSWLQAEQLAGDIGPRSRRNVRTSILTLWTALADERNRCAAIVESFVARVDDRATASLLTRIANEIRNRNGENGENFPGFSKKNF